MDTKKERIWEIDFLRGISIIMMIIFHIIFDLRDIYNYPVYYDRGFIYYMGKVAVITFILISGISSSFSKSNVKRGLKILAIALGITIVTHLYSPALGIKFGILHFFGISMIVYPVFKNMNKYVLIVMGTLIIIAGGYSSNIVVTSNYLFPFGLISSSFVSSDYYPLLPWFGVFLYGIAAGRTFYKEKRSLFNFTLKNNFITFLGRNSLIIYVVHQPAVLLILGLILGYK